MGSDSDNEVQQNASALDIGAEEHDSVTSGAARSKPAWRRFIEVAGPVAVLAVVAPFAVNGIASAVNNTVPSSEPVSAPASPEPAAAATGSNVVTSDTVAPVPNTAPPADPLAPQTVEIAGLADDADDKTISLATEIVAGSPAAASVGTPAADTTPATTAPSAAPEGDGGNHSHGGITPEVALSRGERAALAAELSTARESAMQFATVADAEANGYTLVTGYLPLIGAHYIKWGLMDGQFDPAAPEMLLYDGTEPTSNIVGLSYYLFSGSEPSPFTGANDHWHQHIGLCIRDGVVVGGEKTTQAECAERGGSKAGAENGWMVHAWVVPGWDSPQGVFSPEHVGLTADLPTS